eukprot:UN19225
MMNNDKNISHAQPRAHPCSAHQSIHPIMECFLTI